MRITRPISPARAVCTLGRSEHVLQVEGAGDGPALDAARRKLRGDLRDYLRSHADVASVQVVAAARYGGFTVDQYERGDLL